MDDSLPFKEQDKDSPLILNLELLLAGTIQPRHKNVKKDNSSVMKVILFFTVQNASLCRDGTCLD